MGSATGAVLRPWALVAVVLAAGCGRYSFERVDGGHLVDGDGGDADGACRSDEDCGRCERCTAARRCELATFEQVSLGYDNGCARDELGDVWCWGQNIYYNQGIVDGSGAPFYARPRRIGLGDTVDIAVAWGLGLARTTTGALWGWGSFARGPGLGIGVLDDTQTWVALDAKFFNGCARSSAGTISCVGDNSSGQLGRGTAVLDQILPLAPLDGATDWAEVSTDYATCARKQDGHILCVGRNDTGALGRGTVSAHELDLVQVGTSSWRAVSTNGGSTCAIGTDGSLWCWGGSPENGVGAQVSTPTQIGIDIGWEWVDVRSRYTCGVRAGQLYCWGRSDSPFLAAVGGASTTPEAFALPFDAGTRPVFGASAACTVDGGTWKCFGSNTYGDVGVDSPDATVPTLTPLCPAP
jgi:alpha-tubulin suppressor-like RCC1 family protein